MDNAVGAIVNIRAKLENYQMSKNFRKILTQNKKRFTHVIRKITPIDHPKERLYQQQIGKFDIFIMNSLHTFLYDYSNPNFSIFNTYEVCVYDGEKLVAISFFDLGIHSVASILGLYDNDYQEYSLGTFTLLLEIEFAKANGFLYFYPGYIMLSETGISFEYKLRLDNLQFRDLNGIWQPIAQLREPNWVYKQFQKSRELISQCFEKYNIDYQYFLYPYFAIAKVIKYVQCIEMPCVFGIGKMAKSGMESLWANKLLVVEYILERNSYRLGYISILNDVMTTIMTENILMSSEIRYSGNYLTAPFKYDDILLETNDIDEVISIIKSVASIVF